MNSYLRHATHALGHHLLGVVVLRRSSASLPRSHATAPSTPPSPANASSSSPPSPGRSTLPHPQAVLGALEPTLVKRGRRRRHRAHVQKHAHRDGDRAERVRQPRRPVVLGHDERAERVVGPQVRLVHAQAPRPVHAHDGPAVEAGATVVGRAGHDRLPRVVHGRGHEVRPGVNGVGDTLRLRERHRALLEVGQRAFDEDVVLLVEREQVEPQHLLEMGENHINAKSRTD